MAHLWPHPATHAGRILAELQNHPDGASGAELSRRLELTPQAVNAACRKLEGRCFITRTKANGPLINRLLTNVNESSAAVATTAAADRPWFWEGNVQARVVDALRALGWTITSQADTVSGQPGKDIEAERDGAVLWVTVKGFPVGTKKTSPYTQARHWFSQALFDVILWRDLSLEARIVVALPDKTTYRRLADRTTWFRRAAEFQFIWVTVADVASDELEPLAISPATSSFSRLEPASRR